MTHLPSLPPVLPTLLSGPSQFNALLNPLPDPFATMHHEDDGNGPRTNAERQDADGNRSLGPDSGPGSPTASLRDGLPTPPSVPTPGHDAAPTPAPQSSSVAGTPTMSTPAPPTPLPNAPQGPTLPTPTPTARLDLPLGQIASLANSLGVPLPTPQIPSLPQALRAQADGLNPPNGLPFADGARNGVPFVATPQGAEALRATALAFAVPNAAAPAAGTTVVVPPTLPTVAQPQLAAQAGERALFPGQFVQAARTPDQAVPVQTLRQDAVPLADRLAAAQQAQLAQQAAPLANAQAALAAAAAQVAGSTTMATSATMVAAGNPAATAAGNPLAVAAGERSGAAAGTTLAPAGHTIEGPQRRRMQQSPRRAPRMMQWFQLLGRGRSNARRRERDERDASAAQWLFWLLALVGYAALAFAVVTLVPAESGRHLFYADGTPTRGGLALLIGAGFVLLAWGVARVLRRPAKPA